MVRRLALLIAFVCTSVCLSFGSAQADQPDADTDLAGVIVPDASVGDVAQLIGQINSPSLALIDDGPPRVDVGTTPEGGADARVADPLGDYCSPVMPGSCSPESAEPVPPPAGEPAVTMRDIASFRPAVPGNGMEPGGWAVVGLPANFVAEASVQTLAGTLLGRPAEVRFHPVGYRWTHSDGAVVESSDPGATWAELGRAEFTDTATSHRYAASGEYTVELGVVLAAEYRFNGSVWRWIDGTLAVAAPPQRVLVGEFDTVLVTGDCNARPDGPGC